MIAALKGPSARARPHKRSPRTTFSRDQKSIVTTHFAPLTRADLAEALACISPSLAREDWFRMLAAAKSEFGDEAKQSCRAWSESAADSYDAGAFESTWKSIRAGGKIKIGTLLQEARKNGWKQDSSRTAPTVETPAQKAVRHEAVRAAAAQEQATKVGGHQKAAALAQRLWDAASEQACGHHPYLQRKQVKAIGIRFGKDGTLLIPLRDGAGLLWNLQVIRPDGAKTYLKGSKKMGLWHLLGSLAPPTGARAFMNDNAVTLLVSEGYSTAATLHQITGYPTAVAFDAGGLKPVAQSLRNQYAEARIIVCGDDDHHLAARPGGKNVGRHKAIAAARAVGGLAIFPIGLEGDESDWNDLAGRVGHAEIAAMLTAQINAPQNEPECIASTAMHSRPLAENTASDSNDRDPFSITERGVFFNGTNKDGGAAPPEWICGPLEVTARTRDLDGGEWGYLLQHQDPLGNTKVWAMPARMLSTDGAEYRSVLLSLGLQINAGRSARGHLTVYIQTRKPTVMATCTDRTGWHGHAYVLPKETIGEQDGPLVFQSNGSIENRFRIRGTVNDWKRNIGQLCAGNSRLVFAASCAFAGVALRPAGMESGGFHFRGDSSSGKTTALRVAASVFGGVNYMQRWRTTDSALESIAAQHSDALLILDELAQVDSKIAGEAAYMLANESGRARANRSGVARPRLTWRILFLSAGEIGLAAHMAESNKKARVGQELRMADVPVDAGRGLGAFEDLHGHRSGNEFSDHLKSQASGAYGTTGDAFIRWAVRCADTLPQRIRQSMDATVARWLSVHSSGQSKRVARRFALVAAAGEFATEAGLTGWPVGEATAAARSCFDAWLSARGGDGNGEERAMMRQVHAWLVAHGANRFTWWHRANDDRAPVTINRAGFRRSVDEAGEALALSTISDDSMLDKARRETSCTEWYVDTEIFRNEVAVGFDYLAVLRELDRRGHLVKDSVGGGFSRRERLPGLGKSQVYRLKSSVLGDSDL